MMYYIIDMSNLGSFCVSPRIKTKSAEREWCSELIGTGTLLYPLTYMKVEGETQQLDKVIL